MIHSSRKIRIFGEVVPFKTTSSTMRLKYIFLLLLGRTFWQPAICQSNLVFYSSDATLLLLRLDGDTINSVPQLGLRATNVWQGNHTVDLRLIDNTKGETIQYNGTIYIEPYVEATYVIYRASSNSYFVSLVNKISLLPSTTVVPVYGSTVPFPIVTQANLNPYVSVTTPAYDLLHLSRPETVVKPDFNICAQLLSNGMRDTILQAMRSYSLDEDRYRVAKLGVSSNGLSVQDVKAILGQLNQDDTKLNFVRSAYPYICDKKNFFQLRGLFAHLQTQKDLEEYVSAVNMIK
jgi:hypothetical protein